MTTILLTLFLVLYTFGGFFIVGHHFIPKGPSQFFELSIGQKLFTVIVGGPIIAFILIVYTIVFKFSDFLVKIFNSLK